MYWPKLSTQKIKHHVFEALSKNANYKTENVIGIPGTFLDSEVFYDDAPFLKDAPFISSLVANPNHIGCHTISGEHEDMFSGTQQIEVELINLCAEQIFKAETGTCDGYVASGGTEANIEACWIYRNYFMKERNAQCNEIAVIYSEDSHYSFPKASNLLGISSIVFKVDDNTRQIVISDLEKKIQHAVASGIKHFIVVINLSTTMFGSVDDINLITDLMHFFGLDYKLHIDAAFGGFIYPFTNPDSHYNFSNPLVSSITIDGHKMLQSPYGTGMFLIRKNLMRYVCTDEASYVQGKDYTVCGSRSGANAIAVWMIMSAHGSVGWQVKMHQLLDKTSNLCHKLEQLGVEFYRNPFVNIVAIKSKYISAKLAKQFYLVPDNHESEPKWYKIVVMPHVKQGILDDFLSKLSSELQYQKELKNELNY